MDILLVMEMRERAHSQSEAFKLALVGSDPKAYLPVLYPQLGAPQQVDNISQREVMETDGGQWEFTEQVDPQEAEQLLESMLQSGKGSMSGTDVV